MDSPSGLSHWMSRLPRPSVNPAYLLILLFPCWVLFHWFASQGPRQRDFSMTLLGPDRPVTSAPFPLIANGSDATTISVSAFPPPDTSYNMSLELLDSKGKLLLHADKEGWRETGEWYEDGYSGTYDESDRSFWIRFKPKISGNYNIRLTIESFLSKLNLPVDNSVPVDVQVSSSSSNQGLLFLTFIASGTLALMVLNLSYFRGRCRLRKRAEDVMDVTTNTRAIYPKGIVSIKVSCSFDDISSKFGVDSQRLSPVHMNLVVVDAMGAVRSRHGITRYLSKSSSEEDDSFYLNYPTIYYQLLQPESLRFRIELPECVEDTAELDWIELDLRDQVVVPWPVSTCKLS